ncbi:hypothetical protein DCO56_18455 [Sphingobacterium athyrii]|uniref:DUF4372 domain-containing protein n=1 Tax=Sphingobacterium athyrii TaxID=2152717 RepID=A0A363NQ24_9SPHI|nr:hypothetical protein DCO56_18455 [Sphingobacterium athyrii]
MLGLIDRSFFDRIVRKHDSDKHPTCINSCPYLMNMLFCHLSYADSVRDISNGLRNTTGNIRHIFIINGKIFSSHSPYLKLFLFYRR